MLLFSLSAADARETCDRPAASGEWAAARNEEPRRQVTRLLWRRCLQTRATNPTLTAGTRASRFRWPIATDALAPYGQVRGAKFGACASAYCRTSPMTSNAGSCARHRHLSSVTAATPRGELSAFCVAITTRGADNFSFANAGSSARAAPTVWLGPVPAWVAIATSATSYQIRSMSHRDQGRDRDREVWMDVLQMHVALVVSEPAAYG